MIEILSPAGESESLVAAVRSGADAVYLGTEQFNARRNADNFSYEKLTTATYTTLRFILPLTLYFIIMN